jgi:hypothetical protein
MNADGYVRVDTAAIICRYVTMMMQIRGENAIIDGWDRLREKN